MMQEFKSEIKTFLIVAVVAIVLAVGGIVLLKVMQPASVAQTPPPPAPADQPDEKIIKSVSFEDSNGSHKSLEVTFALPEGRVVYLVDEASNQRQRVFQIGFATIGESPFISPGVGEKYIVFERSGPGDTQNLVILGEEGNMIADTLDSEQYPGLLGYFVFFENWIDPVRFRARASSYGEGPPPLELTMDAATGSIIEQRIKDDTSDWQTYRNEEFGFEVKYPLGGEATKTDYGPRIVLPREEGTNLVGKYLDIAVDGPPPYTGYLSKTEEVFLGENLFTKEIRGGAAAGTANETDNYIINREGRKYTLSFTLLIANLGNFDPSIRPKAFNAEEERKIIDQILSTFRFVE